MQDRIAYQGITFDDVLLEPGYSEVLPRQVDTRTQLTAKIALKPPRNAEARWNRVFMTPAPAPPQ